MFGKRIILGSILLASTFTSAVAIPLTYEIGDNSSITANTSVNDGLAIRWETAPSLSSQAFTLNDGQSYTFDAFKLWTDESWVDADDWKPRSITARLDFDAPDLNAYVHGLTVSGTIYNLSGGLVVWFDPILVDAGSRVFSLNLSNGYFDLGSGSSLGNSPAMIKATVKQLSSGGGVVGVPDGGATAILLGLGLVSIGFLGRRRA